MLLVPMLAFILATLVSYFVIMVNYMSIFPQVDYDVLETALNSYLPFRTCIGYSTSIELCSVDLLYTRLRPGSSFQ